MKATLKSIYDQIKTASVIKWIDEDYGQIDNYTDRPPVQFPAALVSINQNYKSAGGTIYDVTTTIKVRVAHDRFSQRSAMAPEQAITETLNKLSQAEAVRDALQGFENDSCGQLYLKGFETEPRSDGISVKLITLESTHEEIF